MTDDLQDDEFSSDGEENLDHSLPSASIDGQETMIQVDLEPEIANGVYSNLVISNFSSEEFTLDFVYLQPQTSKGLVRSRVILSPRNAKRLSRLLHINVKNFEEKHGSIDEDSGSPGIRLNFN